MHLQGKYPLLSYSATCAHHHNLTMFYHKIYATVKVAVSVIQAFYAQQPARQIAKYAQQPQLVTSVLVAII